VDRPRRIKMEISVTTKEVSEADLKQDFIVQKHMDKKTIFKGCNCFVTPTLQIVGEPQGIEHNGRVFVYKMNLNMNSSRRNNKAIIQFVEFINKVESFVDSKLLLNKYTDNKVIRPSMYENQNNVTYQVSIYPSGRFPCSVQNHKGENVPFETIKEFHEVQMLVFLETVWYSKDKYGFNWVARLVKEKLVKESN
jgi:uncharacterized protein YktA (UPF0223 family)